MDKEKLEFLVRYVSNISPELWKITLAYIYSAAIQWLVAFVGTSVVTLVLFIVNRKTDDDDIKTITIIFGCAFFLISLGCLGAAIGRFNSPDFYAVQYLLQMVPQ